LLVIAMRPTVSAFRCFHTNSSDHHAGRTWGKKGETPIVETTGAAARNSTREMVRDHQKRSLRTKIGRRNGSFHDSGQPTVSRITAPVLLMVWF
jgi:hypothetical protein